MKSAPIRLTALLFANIHNIEAFLTPSRCKINNYPEPYLQRTKNNIEALLELKAVNGENKNEVDEDTFFEWKNTVSVLGAQSALIAGGAGAAAAFQSPIYDTLSFSSSAWLNGIEAVLPLGALAFVLDKVEPYFPPLQDVTKATNRSVLALLGGKRKPLIALGVSLALGAIAGLGEELIFRGVLQNELTPRIGESVSLMSTSVIFGLLHAVTPLYAAIATIASLFFGYIYIDSGFNLAVPIVCHSVYDVLALLWAHYVVTGLSFKEQNDLLYDE